MTDYSSDEGYDEGYNEQYEREMEETRKWQKKQDNHIYQGAILKKYIGRKETWRARM